MKKSKIYHRDKRHRGSGLDALDPDAASILILGPLRGPFISSVSLCLCGSSFFESLP